MRIGRQQCRELQYAGFEGAEAGALRIAQQRARGDAARAAVFPVGDDDAENLVASRADFGIHLQFHREDALRHGDFEGNGAFGSEIVRAELRAIAGSVPKPSFFAASSETIERSGCLGPAGGPRRSAPAFNPPPACASAGFTAAAERPRVGGCRLAAALAGRVGCGGCRSARRGRDRRGGRRS